MKNYSCPYCDCSHLTLYGKVKKIQRYKCKHCKRTFRETSGTPLFRLHKVEKVEKYLKALKRGMSVRKAARYVGISASTSFIWRHKFLSSLPTIESIECNGSDADMQVLTMEYSAKGRKKAPEKNCKPTKTLITQREGQICLYKLSPSNSVKHATEILKKADIPNCVVGTPHKLLDAVINNIGENKKVHISQIIKTSRNILSQQLQGLMDWMERFKGVASKYLQQYWNWYLNLHNLKELKHSHNLFVARCCCERNLHCFQELKMQ